MSENNHNEWNIGASDPLTPSEEPYAEEEQSAESPTEAQSGDGTAADSRDEKIKLLEAELAKSKDQTMRALAELENTRRRAQKDRDEAGLYSITRFARDLLEVSDNLRRALEAAPEELRASDERVESLMTGVEATERELLKSFEKHGIEKIEPYDKIFDPNYHEVMFEAPMPGKKNGTVIQVMEPGYTLKERLLRPARVGVAKNPEDGEQGDRIVDQEA